MLDHQAMHAAEVRDTAFDPSFPQEAVRDYFFKGGGERRGEGRFNVFSGVDHRRLADLLRGDSPQPPAKWVVG